MASRFVSLVFVRTPRLHLHFAFPRLLVSLGAASGFACSRCREDGGRKEEEGGSMNSLERRFELEGVDARASDLTDAILFVSLAQSSLSLSPVLKALDSTSRERRRGSCSPHSRKKTRGGKERALVLFRKEGKGESSSTMGFSFFRERKVVFQRGPPPVSLPGRCAPPPPWPLVAPSLLRRALFALLEKKANKGDSLRKL